MENSVVLQPGEKVYQESQIEELFSALKTAKNNLRDANTKVADQKILINQAIRVFNSLQKQFPGLATGKFQPADVMGAINAFNGNNALIADAQLLMNLIKEYSARNPILLT